MITESATTRWNEILAMVFDIWRTMCKKLLFVVVVIYGVAIGTNTDFDAVKKSILSVSHEGARDLSGGSNNDWGSGTGY